MIRVILICVAFTVLSPTFADAAPARPLYQPQKRLEAPKVLPGLRDSTWEGACYNIPCVIVLKANGTLEYRAGNSKTVECVGTWRLTDHILTFEVNRYSEHRGIFAGDTIQGNSSNRDGVKGTFHLHRIAP
ncbi:MAG TPA: hypothetical protein VFE62_18520 [Gemmataceae bacterium]|nr:hypothetical protein [Gemmataceae bacterium]